ncbi:hypothetical protein [Tissierella sp.]|nr:hypothetical protein [Tissierella sp.]
MNNSDLISDANRTATFTDIKVAVFCFIDLDTKFDKLFKELMIYCFRSK